MPASEPRSNRGVPPKRRVDGAYLPFRAFALLRSVPGLWRHVFLPIAVNVLLYAAVFGLAIWALLEWNVLDVPRWEFWGPIGRWLARAVEIALETLAWIVAIPLLLALAYFTFTTVGMLVAAPFHDALSERAEQAISTMRGERRGFAAAVGSTLRGLGFAARTLLWQLLWIAIALPFLLVPAVGSVPLLAVVAWFSGIGFVDVPLARHDFRLRHRRAFIREHRGAIFTLGLVMEALFLIPFLGLLLLPLGVIGGTILFAETDWIRVFGKAGVDPPPGFFRAESGRAIPRE